MQKKADMAQYYQIIIGGILEYEIFDTTHSVVLGFLVALLVAQCIVLYIKNQTMKNKMDSTIEELLKEERIKFEIRSAEMELDLKERSLSLQNEYESLINSANKKNKIAEEKLIEADNDGAQAHAYLSRMKAENKHLQKLQNSAKLKENEYIEKLEKLSGLSAKDIEALAQSAISKQKILDAENLRLSFFKETSEELELKAKTILSEVIQRAAVPKNAELNASMVRVPNEAMKGRLIGKDGRNIRSFESVSETTLVVDETPDSVMISSFDPAKREIARIALQRLVADGRINPITIESALASARTELEKSVIDAGRAAVEMLGLKGIHPDLFPLIGKLKFHLSLNQNTLEHSIECARIASLVAAELGLDVQLAKRTAFLHDIGKVSDSELPHAKAAAEILRRADESPILIEAVENHHNENSISNVYGAIIKIADAISATRIGARMTPADSYVQRVKTLEEIALSFEGVVSAYALQAGRELRIIVEPDTVDDAKALLIATEVKDKILASLDNSLPVKLTLIREKRITL